MTEVRELTPADAPAVTALYDEYEWWDDRTVEDVRKALSETEVAVGVEDDGTLVAAARVLTDYVYYAYVFDVIVVRNRRLDGVGSALMEAVVSHPELQDVTLSLLCRRGLVQFYQSVGFEQLDGPIEIPEGGAEDLVVMYESGADEQN